jgi:hypothetical protein
MNVNLKYHRLQNQITLRLEPYFITGFSDAESSFMLRVIESKTHKIGWQVKAVFEITLHSKDLPLLKLIQSFFGGIGNIYISSNKETVRYFIEDMKSITSVIIPHFDSYPLQSSKKVNYDLWKQCINLKMKKN